MLLYFYAAKIYLIRKNFFFYLLQFKFRIFWILGEDSTITSMNDRDGPSPAMRY